MEELHLPGLDPDLVGGQAACSRIQHSERRRIGRAHQPPNGGPVMTIRRAATGILAAVAPADFSEAAAAAHVPTCLAGKTIAARAGLWLTAVVLGVALMVSPAPAKEKPGKPAGPVTCSQLATDPS